MKTLLVWCLAGLFAVVMASLIWFSWTFSLFEDVTWREVSRTPCADGQVVAVVMKGEVNATVSTPYKVILTSSDTDQGVLVLKFDRADAPSVHWLEGGIVIVCPQAHVLQFAPVATVAVRSGAPRTVSVRLSATGGVEPSSCAG